MEIIKPYSNESLNTVYNTLFCDMPLLYKNNEVQQNEYPWNILWDTNATHEALATLAADTSIESRVRLLAYRKLTEVGYAVDKKELLGVIIEVPLDKGLDVIAAYKDGTARYINQAEKLLIWETKTDESEKLIANLFAASLQVVSEIGAWDKPRLAQPTKGDVRINFLVADGLYFGQGSFELLAKDAMGGPVIYAATQLMLFLTSLPQK